MLEQKLQDWRKYQQSNRRVKLEKMDETSSFPCLVFFNNMYHSAYIQIIENTTERYIHIINSKRRIGLVPGTFFKIPYACLRGYTKEMSKIILTLQEEEEQLDVEQQDEVQDEVQIELEVEPLVLQFMSSDILDAAFTAIEKFGRERVKMPTPPSSSESE